MSYLLQEIDSNLQNTQEREVLLNTDLNVGSTFFNIC